MNLLFTRKAWQHYLSWQQDRKKLARINELIKSTSRTPYEGIGKPEALKGDYDGYYSRRIDREHRFVYRVNETDDDEDILEIALLRGHY